MKKKIILIGPVYPYKGGISHYTGLLYRTMKTNHDVRMISYSFQYPKFLYKKEQRDYENDTFRINETEFLIHTANPFNWKKVAESIKEWKTDVVIIQWWHPYFTPCYCGLVRHLYKDITIFFLCHNVFPHERFPLDKWLTQMTLRKGNCFIVQSERDANDLQSIIPEARFEQTVHPTYSTFRFQNMTKEDARRLLDIRLDEKILLFFGFVREYKGLRYLIQAMPEIIKTLPETKLLVVGDFGSADNKRTYLRLINDIDIESLVKIYDGYIPDREVEKFFASCDLVVCPYTDATQSGIVQIAYGFEKPVVATNVGGLPDVVSDGKTGYITASGSASSIAAAIIRFFTEEKQGEFTENVRQEAYRFSWDRLREVIETLLSGERGL